jgi:transposase-like protein
VVIAPDPVGSPEQTEESCRRYLEELRWPEAICCPRCDGRSISAIRARRRFYCRGCGHFFSLTSGTVFHNSHLPIWKWFLAIGLLLDSDRGFPANELRKVLGVSYKTAWFAEHRIRAALCEATGAQRAWQPNGDGPNPRTYDRALVGPYHQIGVKYLPAYETEATWRARQTGNIDGFRDTVLALLRAQPVPLDDLTSCRASAAVD